ncbi:nuclear transport factor 2 family protein [Sphingomonas sp.]|uniref:nuclear transport factor 2 family protein n=1 Tax=Sphingomonas sp. TaxID=28214 RepID=UPI002D0ABC5B|nr:nuclear transport factor 2 family protein [Sphingomonas sp.]HWK35695.1 nuclear transport factor 2 family protein [Sphingomonas sp.]
MILPLLLLAQVTPVQPLPKAELPAPPADEAAVLAPITRLFDGIAAKDGARILAQVRPEGLGTAVAEKPDGTRAITTRTWSAFAANFKPGPGPSLEERAVGMPAVEIDGDIAMAWVPYVFLVDGKLAHCGTNHFDLVRDAGQWKILNVTWSQRTTGCEAP